MLAPTDYEGVLDLVVEVAGELRPTEPLPASALEQIRRLIPTADTVADWVGAPTSHRHAVGVAGAYLPWTALEDRLFDRIGFRDPLGPAAHAFGRARRLSDEMPAQAYRATEFYRRLGRRHGLEHSISTWFDLGEGDIRGLWLDSARRDFDPRDIAVLELIGRQLARLGRQERRGRPRHSHGAPSLTDRQAEILALAAVGRSNDEIGRDLAISPNTVRTHLENAFDRLEVHTRAAAVGRAWELGILPRTPRRLA